MEQVAKIENGVLYETTSRDLKFRTLVSGVEICTYNQKYSVLFESYVLNEDGSDKYKRNEAQTGAVFETEPEPEALEAGARALQCIVNTGRYPNMCEKF